MLVTHAPRLTCAQAEAHVGLVPPLQVSDPTPNAGLPLPFDQHSLEGAPTVAASSVAASVGSQSDAMSQLLGDIAATAPPSNLTPSLAQAQSYSAAQQVCLFVLDFQWYIHFWLRGALPDGANER